VSGPAPVPNVILTSSHYTDYLFAHLLSNSALPIFSHPTIPGLSCCVPFGFVRSSCEMVFLGDEVRLFRRDRACNARAHLTGMGGPNPTPMPPLEQVTRRRDVCIEDG